MWMAGGGIKGGTSVGKTDDLGATPSNTASTSKTCTRRSCSSSDSIPMACLTSTAGCTRSWWASKGPSRFRRSSDASLDTRPFSLRLTHAHPTFAAHICESSVGGGGSHRLELRTARRPVPMSRWLSWGAAGTQPEATVLLVACNDRQRRTHLDGRAEEGEVVPARW